jgi:hypothetical protein
MRKFRISFILLLAVIISVNFHSCKDDFTEKDAMKLQTELYKNKKIFDDSLANSNSFVSYTVTIVDAAKSMLKSANVNAGLDGATVTLAQNGAVISQTSSDGGYAIFPNLLAGSASVGITLANYAPVNYVVDLGTGSTEGGKTNGTIIPMIPISGTSTSTIKGKITCESNLTNLVREAIPTGTKVIAVVSSSSGAFPTGITKISYGDLSLETTTDANGNYSLTVPATLLGLTYDIRVEDFTISQSLLVNKLDGVEVTGVQSVLTEYGSLVTGTSTVPTVNPVIVTIGAPSYTYTPAAATAVVDNTNGIDFINITSAGGSYSAPGAGGFKVTVNSPVTSVTGKAVASLTMYSNRVASVSVGTKGNDYPTTAEGANFSVPYVYGDFRAGVATVSSGGIATLTVPANRRGIFYNIDTAAILETYTINGSGSGARVVFNFSWNGSGYYEVTSAAVAINPTGSGYSVGDTIGLRVRSGKANYMTGVLHMTTGSVSAINVTTMGANYISGSVDVVIAAPATGTTALATATVTNGQISAISVGTHGTGYTTPPTVTIVNKAEAQQAKATATVTSGIITALNLSPAGKGYLTVPTVSIIPQVTGIGSGASAYATVSGGVVTLNLVNGGSGYLGVNTPTTLENGPQAVTTVTVKGGAPVIKDIHLGTGTHIGTVKVE